MSIISRILDSLPGRARAVAAAEVVTLGLDDGTDASVLPSAMGSGLFRSSSPPPRGSRELLTLYRDAPNLRMVSHKIAFNMAGVRWCLYAKRGAKGGRKYVDLPEYKSAPLVERMAMRKKYLDDGTMERIESHPFLDVFDRPNQLMTGRAFRHVGQVHLDLLGETYIVFDSDNLGTPTRMWIIPPTWITDVPSSVRPFYKITIDGTGVEVPASNVVCIRDPNPADPFGRGAGTGMALTDELDVDEFAAKHLASWFSNKGMPDMLVSLEGANQPVVERAKRAWDSAVKGFAKAYRTHWTGAKLNVQRLDTTFKDMALIEIRKFERDAIIQTFGVPPEKLGIIANSNRSTSESAHFIFANDVLVPRLELWRSELQFKLIERYDERLLLDYESPVPGDREFQRSIATAFSEMFTIDEIRAMADMPPLPDGKGQAHLIAGQKAYVQDLSTLGAPPVYGYHLSAGAMTYNELRATLRLPPAKGWGEERTTGTYVDPASVLTEEQAKALATASPDDRKKLLAFAGVRGRKSAEVDALADAAAAAVSTGALADHALPLVEELLRSWGDETIKALDPETSFTDNTGIKAFLDSWAADRIGALVDETTKTELMAALAGLNDASRDAAVNAVRDVFDRATLVRTDIIASVEVIRTSQFAAKDAMAQSGIIIENEWIATLDGRTREAHLAMDGQRRELGEPFEVPAGNEHAGAQALQPGGFGIASLDINCRCVVGAVIPTDDEVIPNAMRVAVSRGLLAGVWKGQTHEERVAMWNAINNKLLPWDARLARALIVGFRAQERAVLAALEPLLND